MRDTCSLKSSPYTRFRHRDCASSTQAVGREQPNLRKLRLQRLQQLAQPRREHPLRRAVPERRPRPAPPRKAGVRDRATCPRLGFPKPSHYFKIGTLFSAHSAKYTGEAPGPSLLERAITRVVVEFWGRLRGFAAHGLPRKGWGQVGPRHPFPSGVAGELHCAWPERLVTSGRTGQYTVVGCAYVND